MEQFRNRMAIFNILERDGNYALLERTGSNPEIVIACNIHGEDEGYWDSGKYFSIENKEKAMEVYRSYTDKNFYVRKFIENIKKLGFEEAVIGNGLLWMYVPKRGITIFAEIKNHEYRFSTCCNGSSYKEEVIISTPWESVEEDFEWIRDRLKFLEIQVGDSVTTSFE